MSEIGKIHQLTTTTHSNGLRAAQFITLPPTISLAEHDRTINRLLGEIAALKAERAHSVHVLTTFTDAPLSVSSLQPLYTLLDDLLDGPKEKKVICAEHQ